MLDLVGTPVELTGMLAATPRNGVLPKVGELWLLSWDRSFLGLACIAEIHDDFVSAWPVTLPAEASFAPALMVPLGGWS